jgi:hypothetical protein
MLHLSLRAQKLNIINCTTKKLMEEPVRNEHEVRLKTRRDGIAVDPKDKLMIRGPKPVLGCVKIISHNSIMHLKLMYI